MADKLEGSAIVANTVSGDRIVTGSITTTQLAPSVANFVNEGKPLKIRTITYPGNDTAANTGGSQTIVLTGSGFKQNVQVYINSNAVPSVTYANANSISFTSPALAAATYPIYVINTDDGATAILIPGIQYSGTPTWSTSTPLTTQQADTAWNIQLIATSDSAVSYSLQAGSSLPAGITLAANGLISGTMSSPPEDETTYNFTVVANDLEQQDASRAFSVSVTVAVLDPYFTYTTLLLHGDGTNNANNHAFVDSSNNNFAITRNGNATQGTFSPFGDNWSYYFDGNDYLNTASSDAFTLGSSEDFTIEFWMYPDGAYSATTTLLSTYTDFNSIFSNRWSLNVITGSNVLRWFNSSGNIGIQTTPPPINTWTHVAIVRSGSTITMYINGTAVGTQTSTYTYTTENSLKIGYVSGADYFKGYFSNVRIVKGTAVYTSNFTVPTQPLLPISNTSILTCESNAFVDDGPRVLPITVNGNPRITKFDPFKPYKAIPGSYGVYFDGTGDNLSVASNTAFAYGSGDFTVEFWMNRTGTVSTSDCGLVDQRGGVNGSYFMCGLTTSQQLFVYLNSAYRVGPAANTTINANRWYHVAYVRSATTGTLYLDGTSVGSWTDSLTYVTNAVAIANHSAGGVAFPGHLSNLRITKGTAVYSSAFTPPTSPLTAIANTSLLTCQSTTIVDNSTNAFTITRNGDARPTDLNPFTTVFVSEKYNAANGGGSLYVDGTGDYLTAPSNTALAFGTSNFTVEAWVYRNSSGSVTHFVDFRGSNNNGSNPVFYFQTNNYLYYTNDNTSGDNQIQTSNPVIAGVWTHIALVRSGTTLTAYINGVASGSTTYSTNVLGGNVTTIANRFNDSGAFNGYISNLRILKGTAAYTNNFVPPTGPVTNTANASLLCNFTNAGIIDSVGKLNFETIGATSNTTTKKFGSGSIYLNGSSYLTSPRNDVFNFDVSDFTVEFWINASASGTYTQVIGTLSNGADEGTWRIGNRFNSTNAVYFARGNGQSFDEFSAAVNVNDGNWHHVAVTRNNTVVRIFVDGVIVGSSTIGGTCTFTNGLVIGYNLRDNTYMTGYLDDIRITKGLARYRYNFTPPTKAFNDGDGNLATLTSDVLVGDQVNAPMFPYTTLLLPGNGTNNQNNHTFLDSSNNNFAITRNGNATQGTFSPFSQTGWSNYFDGTGDYLNTADNAAYAYGSSDFTVESWIYPTALPGSGSTVIIDQRESTPAGGGFSLEYTTTGRLDIATGSVVLSSSSNLVMNQWQHIAMCRNGTTLRLFINGVQVGSVTNSTNLTSQRLTIGAYTNRSSSYFPGYISNLRLIKGSALYTSNFTPSSTPLTAVSNTSLLTLQSNRFIDNSTNVFTITRNGDTSVQAFSPFAPSVEYTANTHGGSAYFDGSGDYLTAPNNAAFDFGSGDWTVEAWVYPLSLAAPCSVISKRTNTDADYRWIVANIATNGTIYTAITTTGSSWVINTTTTSTVSVGQWSHIAWVRNGSDVSVYVNGVKNTLSSGFSGSLYVSTEALNIGVGGTTGSYIYPMNGYMSGVRLVKGTAVYTATFTPPTAPLTAVANTQLLCNFTNAGILDSTGKNVLETVGDAKISTAQSKFGGSSMTFDGNGDNLFALSSPNLNLTTGDWTLEAWVYLNSLSASQTIVCVHGGTYGINWWINTSGRLVVDDGQNPQSAFTSPSVSATTWTHVALTRSGTTTRGFVNGILVGSNTFTPQTCSILLVGRFTSGTTPQWFNGYIDDLRITKGIARYTTNFTPPTTAFLLK